MMRLLELVILGTPGWLWRRVRPLIPRVVWRTKLDPCPGACAMHSWTACVFSGYAGRKCTECGRVDVAGFAGKSDR